jgi:uncharacterized phage-associated protein
MSSKEDIRAENAVSMAAHLRSANKKDERTVHITLYVAQLVFLAQAKTPLFGSSIEAREFGPVVSDAWQNAEIDVIDEINAANGDLYIA